VQSPITSTRVIAHTGSSAAGVVAHTGRPTARVVSHSWGTTAGIAAHSWGTSAGVGHDCVLRGGEVCAVGVISTVRCGKEKRQRLTLCGYR
jgi:hypothetical protein